MEGWRHGDLKGLLLCQHVPPADGSPTIGLNSPGALLGHLSQELEALDMSPALIGGIGGGPGGSGGLGSPVVQGVLDRWIDVGKRRILEGWLAHVLHGGPVDTANGCFVPRVQMSSLSKEV